jgi:alpha-amylase/alpha-mannosidase (GH57 family)
VEKMEDVSGSKKFFLWFHMHQPSYEIPESEYLYLPWVRRHMLNGYYMVPKLLLDSEARVNINFSGILLKQMKLYEEDLVKDAYQYYEEKEVDSLSAAERIFIIDKFLIPLPFKSDRFRYLLEKKMKKESLSTQEILDTQVLFSISAFALPEEEILEMLKKGRNFSENDKLLVMKVQEKTIKSVIPTYKALMAKNQIEITISPYYHPILPLLIDQSSALESKGGTILPETKFAYPEDAEIQISKSLEVCERVFGTRPKGLWPSEGSISNEAIDIIKKLGFDWIGSDELILSKAKETSDKKAGIYDVRNLKVFFRDHHLSDKIGFIYNKMEPADAVKDLLNNQEAVKVIILDGENPWTFYPDNGVPFLKELFKNINKNNSLLGSEAVSSGKINSIKPGSWINGYFDTWIGNSETNNAWTYLTLARESIGKNEKAMNDILMAEGSDSFWWYSDYHRNEVDFSFDYMFRARLINAYKNAGKSVPCYLFYTIKKP